MEHFNFNENFNNKLLGEWLTTIRSARSIKYKNLRIGDRVELQLNHIPVAIATVEEMQSFNLLVFFKHPTYSLRMLLAMDMGTDWIYAYNTIMDKCGEEVTLVLLNIDKRL